LNSGPCSEELMSIIQDKLKSKYLRTVILLARDSYIDEAVQLSIVIKNEVMHGLHQTTTLSLASRDKKSGPLTKHIFTEMLGYKKSS